MTPPPPWSVIYADGSANRYRFEAGDGAVGFTYDPMTPARSSTGMYSGGEPRAFDLAVDDPRLAELWRLVDGLVADTAHHAGARCKGDGALTVTRAGETREVLVVRAATRAIEALLEGLRA